jgi:hypothetical protein
MMGLYVGFRVLIYVLPIPIMAMKIDRSKTAYEGNEPG